MQVECNCCKNKFKYPLPFICKDCFTKELNSIDELNYIDKNIKFKIKNKTWIYTFKELGFYSLFLGVPLFFISIRYDLIVETICFSFYLLGTSIPSFVKYFMRKF